MKQGKNGFHYSLEEYQQLHPEKFENYPEYEGHRNPPESGEGSHSFGEKLVKRKPYDPEAPLACPYCFNDTHLSFIKSEGNRPHCGKCNRSFTGTTGTEYHATRIDPKKLNKLKDLYRESYTVRDAARASGLNKNTVTKWFQVWDERAEEQTPGIGRSTQKKPQPKLLIEDHPCKQRPINRFALFGNDSPQEEETQAQEPQHQPEPQPEQQVGLLSWLFGSSNQSQSQQETEVEETVTEAPPPKKSVNRFALFGNED